MKRRADRNEKIGKLITQNHPFSYKWGEEGT